MWYISDITYVPHLRVVSSNIYSTFWVGCPDCDLKFALDHAARDIGNHSSRALRGTLDTGFYLGQIRSKSVATLLAGWEPQNEGLIIEVSVGMWLVETICTDLLGAIDTIS